MDRLTVSAHIHTHAHKHTHALSIYFIRYTCTVCCYSVQQICHKYKFNLYEVYNVQFLLTLSELCKFNYMFITEVRVKGGVGKGMCYLNAKAYNVSKN